MRFSKIVSTVVFSAMVLGLASSARAESIFNNVGFGYNLLRPSASGGSFNMNGIFVDATGQITPMQKALSWVADLGWGKHSESDQGLDVSLKVTTVQVAVRYSFLQNMMYTPWAQVGGGLAHQSLSADCAGCSQSSNDGLFSLLGGIDYPVGKMGWAVRGAVGYAHVSGDNGGNALIVRAGVTKGLK